MMARELHSPVGSWRDHVRPVSELVTDSNIRYWMRLVLECSDELGSEEFADVWMAGFSPRREAGVGYWDGGRIEALVNARYPSAAQPELDDHRGSGTFKHEVLRSSRSSTTPARTVCGSQRTCGNSGSSRSSPLCSAFW